MVQALSHRTPSAEVRFQSLASPRWIYVGQSGTGSCLSPSSSLSPVSSIPPMSHIHSCMHSSVHRHYIVLATHVFVKQMRTKLLRNMLSHTCDSNKRKQRKCPQMSSLLPIVRYRKNWHLICLQWLFFTARCSVYNIVFMNKNANFFSR